MPESSLLQVLVQSGSVGIALVALYIIYKMSKDQNTSFRSITDDHRKTIDRNTDAWLKNTEVLSKLNERIK